MAQKNQTEKTPVYVKVTLIIFAILLVFAAAFAVIRYTTGILQRASTAVTVGDQKLSAMDLRIICEDTRADFLYQYGSYFEMMGLDLANIDNEIYDKENNMTWGQYFIEQGVNSAMNMAGLVQLAEESGFELSEDDMAAIDDDIASLEEAAAENGISVNDYLSTVYGRNTTVSDIRKVSEFRTLASSYYRDLTDGYSEEITNEQIENYYNENRTMFDLVDFYEYSIKYGENEEKTEEAASLLAEEIKGRLDSELTAEAPEKFDEIIKEYAGEDYTTGLYEGYSLANSGADVNWINENGAPGAVAKINDSDNSQYLIIFLLKTYRPEDKTVNARHILLKTAEIAEDATDEEKAKLEADNAEIEAKAKALYEEFKQNPTEESFASLAKKNSEDTSKSQGGLIKTIMRGQMVEAFDEWCFDESRKPGDNGLVKTEYGWHLMYFCGDGEPEYAASIRQTLVGDKYQSVITEKLDSLNQKFNTSALSLM